MSLETRCERCGCVLEPDEDQLLGAHLSAERCITALQEERDRAERRVWEMANAALHYDAAIYAAAGTTAAREAWAETNDDAPVFVGVEAGEDLDRLYFEWVERARKEHARLAPRFAEFPRYHRP